MFNLHDTTFRDTPTSFHPSWGPAPSFYKTNQQPQAQPFKCFWNTDGQQCHKYFSSPEELGYHVKEKHAKGRKICQWSTCGKDLKYKCRLVHHLPVHTGERAFRCDTCQKAYGQKEHLKHHQKIHTGQKPWSPKTCSQRHTISDEKNADASHSSWDPAPVIPKDLHLNTPPLSQKLKALLATPTVTNQIYPRNQVQSLTTHSLCVNQPPTTSSITDNRYHMVRPTYVPATTPNTFTPQYPVSQNQRALLATPIVTNPIYPVQSPAMIPPYSLYIGQLPHHPSNMFNTTHIPVATPNILYTNIPFDPPVSPILANPAYRDNQTQLAHTSELFCLWNENDFQCLKKLHNPKELGKHIEEAHLKTWKTGCMWENCRRKYTRKDALRFHVRQHTGEMPHVCTVCGEEFERRCYLNAHRKKHTGC